MKRLIFLLILLIPSYAHADRIGILAQESDGTPAETYVYKINFANGTLSITGGVGTFSLSGYEPALTDEASLYSTLSDVIQFYEAGDEDTIAGLFSEGAYADSTIVTGDIKDLTIVNADISASAAIALSKVQNLFQGVTPALATLADGDTDFTVANEGLYYTNGLGAVTIDDFSDADQNHSEFVTGDYIGIVMDDATVKIDMSGNANIEGNANTDFTGSASHVVTLIYMFFENGYGGAVDDHWVCLNYNMGFSDATTFPVKLGHNTLQDADGGTMTEAQSYNTTWQATGAGTIVLQPVGEKMNFCVENHTAGDVLIDPDGTDAIKLNGGTQLTDGFMIIGTDIGDGCCCEYFEAGAWSCWCEGYEDNGS